MAKRLRHAPKVSRSDGTTELGRADELYDVYHRTRDPAVLDETIALLRVSVAAAVSDPDRADRLSRLGIALRMLFSQSSDLAALREAVEAGRGAVAALPVEHQDRAMYLAQLGEALRALFEQDGEPATIREAVRVGVEAFESVPDGHVGRATYLNHLGATLQAKYVRFGDPAALDQAVDWFRATVDAVPADSPRRAGYQADLAEALRMSFERTGDLTLLAEALDACRNAVGTAAAGQPELPGYLTTLANTLRLKFERTWELTVLKEAVQAHRDAVDATPIGHASRADRLLHLGSALQSLYAQTQETSALEEAAERLRVAVSAAPSDHPDQPVYLTNLSRALGRLFDETGDESLLDEAVRTSRSAVAAVSAGRLGLVSCLDNLASALERWVEHAWDESVFDEVVRTRRTAIAAASADHPLQARIRYALAVTLERQYARAADPALLAEIEAVLAPAVTSPNAPVALRIAAGAALAETRLVTCGPEMALSTLEAVLELLSRLAPRSWPRADRQHGLGRVGRVGVAAGSAALAVAAGRPDRAVELLEQIRGLLMREAIDDHGEMAELRDAAPDLADELDDLRRRITALETAEAMGSEPNGGYPAAYRVAAQIGEQRRRLTEQWAAAMNRIRTMAGFERFLRAPVVDRLRNQAADGPVITVYAADTGGTALVLTNDPGRPVRVVPLPDLTDRAVGHQVGRLRTALDAADGPVAGRAEAERELYGILGWLWDSVAGPVLDDLGLAAAASEPPRIWWCPVGALAHLPIHAAGHHLQPTGRTVLDRTVSSYVPTLRALEHTRKRPAPSTGPALIVALPTTPDAPHLAGARRDIRELTRLLANPRLLLGADATHDAVVHALTHHPIAHFACHGLSDQDNPSAGRLLLHDHAATPFTVATLARLRLADAELAYLSACGTTETAAPPGDEAVHLTAALHLVGYRHVIGTLWPIDGVAAARLAADFYTHLTGDGAYAPRTEDCAVALTLVTRSLRDEYPATPTRWAAHVHQGA